MVDQLIIPKLLFFFILVTYLIDILLILWGEILSWSLMGIIGLINMNKKPTKKYNLHGHFCFILSHFPRLELLFLVYATAVSHVVLGQLAMRS